MSWREKTLGEVMTLKRGYDLPEKKRRHGPIPVVSSSGITGFHSEARAEPPGVVTGRYGTLGEVFFIEEPYWPLNTALYVVDFKGNNPRFVAYLLQEALRNYRSEKAAVPGFDRNVLHMLKVRSPGPREQGDIVSILSAYDDLIENNGRRIVLLEEAARLLYREWFVELRFPGYQHIKVVDGVPEGWCRGKLRDVAETNEESYRAEGFPEEINYIDISSVERGRIVSRKRLSADRAPSRARRKVSDGNIIWSNVRPNLRAYALVLEPDEVDVVSTGFTVLAAKSVPFTWLYEFVTTDFFVGHLVNNATGAGYPAVRPGDFERVSLSIAPDWLLTRFHEVVEPMFRMIAKLDR